MSVTDALSRISEIQSHIQQIQTGSLSTSSTDATDSADSSTSFADALAAAGTSTDATSAASTATPITSTSAGLVQNGTTGDDIVADARKYLGVPYVFGGTTTSGMDCSGLVQTVFKDKGVTMPRVVPDQAKVGVAVPSLAQAKPGDLIVEKGSGHIQIYAGNGMIIEAPKPGENVVERKEWLTSDQIGSIRRIVPATSDVQAAAAASASSSLSSLSASSSLSSLSSLSSSSSSTQTDMLTAMMQQLLNLGASA